MLGQRTRGQRIIPREHVSLGPHTCIVGGDADEPSGKEVPTIVLEKDAADNVVRIMVRCPCGRTSELVCSYE